MLMDDPQAGELVGQTIHQVEFHTLSQEADGWVMECSRRLLEEAGPLTAHIPEEQRQDRTFRFKMQPDGTLKDLGQGLPARRPCFPTVPLDAGSAWETRDQRPGEPALTIYNQLARLEQREGQLQADLVSTAATVLNEGEGTLEVTVESIAVFSVEEGKLLSNKTQVDQKWSQGRLVQTALELELTT